MDYNPRRILHMLRLGLGERVLRSQAIWLCTACYSCTARCPREIKITDAMLGLRRLAIDEGIDIPPNMVTLRDTVTSHHNISGDDNTTRFIWSENLEEDTLASGISAGLRWRFSSDAWPHSIRWSMAFPSPWFR
jgi:heterodisulfide reductase subunit C